MDPAVIAAALGQGANIGLDVAGFVSGRRAAEKEYKHFKRRYQIMRADLEKAGLNPMLAFGGQMPGMPPSGAAAFEGHPLDPLAGSSAASAAVGRDLTRQQADLVRQEKQTSSAMEALHKQQALESEARTKRENYTADWILPAEYSSALAATKWTDVKRRAEELGIPYLENEAAIYRALGPKGQATAQALKYVVPTLGIGAFLRGRGPRGPESFESKPIQYRNRP